MQTKIITPENDVSSHAPLLDRLLGRAYLPGVHFATQAQAWMGEAADEIERLREKLERIERLAAADATGNDVCVAILREFPVSESANAD